MEFFIYSTALKTNLLASALIDYFWDSNLAGQAIVVILFLMSVVAWAVMFMKYADLSTIDELNIKAAKCVKSSASLINAVSSVRSIPSPYSVLLKEALNARSDAGNCKNVNMKITMVENALARRLARQISKYEEKMTLLGTVISGAPFLGLLGTAWGVMDCFGSMSSQTSVTLQQLAPGVSGALLTTVAGLVVAIPSVFGYNFLSTKIKKMIVDTENFAGLLSDKVTVEAMSEDSPAVATREPKQTPLVERVVKGSAEADKVIDFSLDDDSIEMSNFDDE